MANVQAAIESHDRKNSLWTLDRAIIALLGARSGYATILLFLPAVSSRDLTVFGRAEMQIKYFYISKETTH